MDLKYFNISEFDSPDLVGSGEEMKASFLNMLDKCRELADTPFYITSGFRTYEHNKSLVGSSLDSSHLNGFAADIRCLSSVERFKIIKAALEVGFNRIGIGNTFIHLDNDPTKPKNVIWNYG